MVLVIGELELGTAVRTSTLAVRHAQGHQQFHHIEKQQLFVSIQVSALPQLSPSRFCKSCFILELSSYSMQVSLLAQLTS